MLHMEKRAKNSVSIRELHSKTGEVVRRAGASSVPVPVTDRGQVVAMLVGPGAVPLKKRAKRVLSAEYVKLILEGPLSNDVLEDLDAVRGER
jgi:antitoxin (DNA-binding transcriptional repressor) of toxin-antitoxin stability system